MPYLLPFMPIYKINEHELDTRYLLINNLKTQTTRPKKGRIFHEGEVVWLTIHPCRTCKHEKISKAKILIDTEVKEIDSFTIDDVIREGFIDVGEYKNSKKRIPIINEEEFISFYKKLYKSRKSDSIIEVNIHKFKKIGERKKNNLYKYFG